MKTRMERYYQNEENTTETRSGDNTKRAVQNQELYEQVVDINPYTDNNQIDLNKLENLIRSQETPKKDYKSLLQVNNQINEELNELERDLDRTFDINKIINKVKEETEVKGRTTNLNNTQYDILSKVEIDIEDTAVVEEDPEETLKELFHTITTNSLMSKDRLTSELALDVLSDLKPSESDTEVVEGLSEETQDTAPFSLDNAKPLKAIVAENQITCDQTVGDQAREFFTGNLDFKEDDFEDFSDLETAMKSNNKLIWILVIILIIILLGAGFYIYTNFL